jgi:phosphate/sulfate permease
MTVQAASTRPVGKTSGAAGLGAALQLIVFVVVVVTFLIAPLLALAVAFLVYTVMRGRGQANNRPANDAAQGPAFGFGSGVR